MVGVDRDQPANMSKYVKKCATLLTAVEKSLKTGSYLNIDHPEIVKKVCPGGVPISI